MGMRRRRKRMREEKEKEDGNEEEEEEGPSEEGLPSARGAVQQTALWGHDTDLFKVFR